MLGKERLRAARQYERNLTPGPRRCALRSLGPSPALAKARAGHIGAIHPSSTDMNQPNITTEHANRAADRRTKLRLRDLCDEVLASYHQARGHELFSSEDRNAARELMAALVRPQ